MAKIWNKLAEARKLAMDLGFSPAELPQVTKLRESDMRGGMVGLEDPADTDAGIVLHWATIENMIWCRNPASKNVGSWLWEEGYLLYPEYHGNRVVYRLEYPSDKVNPRRFLCMTDAGIAALKHAKKDGLKYEKPDWEE